MDLLAHKTTVDSGIVNENWVTAYSKIINENLLTANLEIINENCVATNSEINNDGGVLSGFIFFNFFVRCLHSPPLNMNFILEI
jgi:hypothetical protein